MKEPKRKYTKTEDKQLVEFTAKKGVKSFMAASKKDSVSKDNAAQESTSKITTEAIDPTIRIIELASKLGIGANLEEPNKKEVDLKDKYSKLRGSFRNINPYTVR